MMEAAYAYGLPELHGMARALDVGGLLVLGAGLEVVDRRQMEQMVDLSLELLLVRLSDPQALLGEIADDGDDVLVGGAPLLAQRIQLLDRALADQHIDRLAPLQQVADEELPDKAGGTGDKIGHRILLALWSWRTRPRPSGAGLRRKAMGDIGVAVARRRSRSRGNCTPATCAGARSTCACKAGPARVRLE